ncbi:MAG: alpha/beta hydrolase [Bacteroidales bacterium]|nr:alpha/beta hydrolase [Bacteroidales bacterium]
MKKTILAIMAVLAAMVCKAQDSTTVQAPIEPVLPDATYMFAQRDTCELFMDVYEPAKGSQTTFEGKVKPAILFMFGGGFIGGRRDDPDYLPWYRKMTENGYRVIAIDYRLGLKGSTSVGLAQVNALDNAIHLAVEDLYSATMYMIDNADALGIDPDSIVICGSSAGAITVLQAEYELCNRTEYASSMPEGFRYAGVMSFSGGILSRDGKLKYDETPCPTALFHGTADKLVNYKQITFFNIGFYGSEKIARRFAKFGYNYNIIRFLDHGHEVAGFMEITTDTQFRFIENNVMKDEKSIVDIIVDDPRLEKGKGSQSRKELYGK